MSEIGTDVFNLFRLNGRRALVTGGAKGLGRVIATTLAAAGADVVLVSRTLAECQATADAIGKATGRTVTAAAADVGNAAAVDRLFAEVTGGGSKVDILVNSAGLNVRKPVQSLEEAEWDAVMDVNLKAPFLLARKFGPAMVERGWGRIVHLGSILSAIGIANRTPYASSKSGLIGLTRVLAMEFASRGVTVNALCPGPFATDMNKQLLDDPAQYAAFVAKIPMGRWGELGELTGAALFLSSDASSYMTGNTLYVDGGWTAQ